MFGPSNWTIIGLRPESHDAFLATFGKESVLLNISQLTASAVTRSTKIPTVGFNPFESPRIDERIDLTPELVRALVEGNKTGFEDPATVEAAHTASDELNAGFVSAPGAYQIDPTLPVYAMWFIVNSWKDNADAASLKEGKAYDDVQRPYKFLSAEERRNLDLEVAAYEAPARKQYPVILDFQKGRVYTEVTSDKLLFELDTSLKGFGADTYRTAWSFGEGDWISAFLNKTHQNTRFAHEFQEAARDRKTFTEGETAEQEDPEVTRMVKDYFALAELESETWVGLQAPAGIQMYNSADPVDANTPTSATQLLQVSSDAHICTASITLEEQISYINKEGQERVFRLIRHRMDLNHNIHGGANFTAAQVRGFDMPSFVSQIRKEIRKNKEVPEIREFWFRWLQGLEDGIRRFTAAVSDTLELEPGEYGIVEFLKKETEAGEGVITVHDVVQVMAETFNDHFPQPAIELHAERLTPLTINPEVTEQLRKEWPSYVADNSPGLPVDEVIDRVTAQFTTESE